VSNSVNATLDPAPTTLCVTVQVDLVAEHARLATAYPNYERDNGAVWSIVGLPDPDSGPLEALSIAEPLVSTTFAPAAAISLAVKFANPFGEMPLFLAMTAHRGHQVGNVIYPLGTSTFMPLEAVTPSCVAHPIPAGAAGIPIDVALAGTPLDTDDKAIDLGGAPTVALTWDTTSGAADLYAVLLLDVTTDTPVTLRQWKTTQPSIVVDTKEFAITRRYLFSVGAVLGVPDVGTGAFDTFAYPVNSAIGNSSTFQISP
jgi:hypothetical protein